MPVNGPILYLYLSTLYLSMGLYYIYICLPYTCQWAYFTFISAYPIPVSVLSLTRWRSMWLPLSLSLSLCMLLHLCVWKYVWSTPPSLTPFSLSLSLSHTNIHTHSLSFYLFFYLSFSLSLSYYSNFIKYILISLSLSLRLILICLSYISNLHSSPDFNYPDCILCTTNYAKSDVVIEVVRTRFLIESVGIWCVDFHFIFTFVEQFRRTA